MSASRTLTNTFGAVWNPKNVLHNQMNDKFQYLSYPFFRLCNDLISDSFAENRVLSKVALAVCIEFLIGFGKVKPIGCLHSSRGIEDLIKALPTAKLVYTISMGYPCCLPYLG